MLFRRYFSWAMVIKQKDSQEQQICALELRLRRAPNENERTRLNAKHVDLTVEHYSNTIVTSTVGIRKITVFNSIVILRARHNCAPAGPKLGTIKESVAVRAFLTLRQFMSAKTFSGLFERVKS